MCTTILDKDWFEKKRPSSGGLLPGKEGLVESSEDALHCKDSTAGSSLWSWGSLGFLFFSIKGGNLLRRPPENLKKNVTKA